MLLLIDGYNLLHVTGIFGSDKGASSLETSRRALLRFLANVLDESRAARTTVVFDASGAPPGLPQLLTHRGISVRFAVGYDEADDLLEELISKCSSPKTLTVVSSDHRVQRAARRRGATWIDSDVWFASSLRRRRTSVETPPVSSKPEGLLSADEVAWWLDEFAESIDALRADERASHDGQRPSARLDMTMDDSIGNPFPPGYAEDLLDEQGDAPR